MHPQHVQHEAALLITVRVEHREWRLATNRVHHRTLRHDRRGDDLAAQTLQFHTKRRVTARPLCVHSGEIGRDAFRQPEIGPASRRNRVPKPLMGRFVRDQTNPYGVVAKRPVGVEDRRGVLHPAKARRRLHVRQSGVHEWAHQRRKRRHDASCLPKTAWHVRGFWTEGEHRLRHAASTHRSAARGASQRRLVEVRRANDHQIRGNRLHQVKPRRHPCAAIAMGHRGRVGHTCPVGHHRSAKRGRDAPTHGCLVAGVINRGNPIPRAIGPVVAERTPAAEGVLADDQPVRRRAMIPDLHPQSRAVSCEQWNANGHAVAHDVARSAVHRDRIHQQCDQVETECIDGARPSNAQRCRAANFSAERGERERDIVVLHVNAWLIRKTVDGSDHALCVHHGRHHEQAAREHHTPRPRRHHAVPVSPTSSANRVNPATL